jgi:HK97 family phage prohead protease
MDICYGEPLPLSEVKAATGGWEVSGYASSYNNIDYGGDTVVPGAFDGWIKGWSEGANKTRFLFSHQSSQILGTPVEMRSDDRGLFVRAKISKTALGNDVHTLLQDKALDSFSIGYRPVDTEPGKGGTRRLKTIELPEFSLVAMPMDSHAIVTGFKGRFCPECGESLTSKTHADADHPLQPLNTDAAFDELMAQLRGYVGQGVDEAEALGARRAADSRKLSQAHIDALEALNAELKGSSQRIEALLNAPAREVRLEGPSPLRLRIELARRRARAAGVELSTHGNVTG